MPVSRGRAGTPGNPYNSLTLKPNERPRQGPVEVRPETQQAIWELELVRTLEEFAMICAAQKKKRGW